MNYIIDNKFKVKTNHGSKGCQIKYCRNNYWYKIDNGCSEGKNEHIASIILKCTNLTNYVYYESCEVNGYRACRSYNFLNENEMFVTFSDIIGTIYGVENPEDMIWSIRDVYKRYEFLVDVVKIYTNNKLDISEYLKIIFYLDLFILNRDRHLNNLGIITDISTEEFRPAPIFDNGLSFLGGCQGMIYDKGIEYAVNKQNARTISGSFVEQVLASTQGVVNCPFKIDFKKLHKKLKNDKAVTNLHKLVLQYQYQSIGDIYK